MNHLDADRDEIAHFVDALFRHASEGTCVSLRAFSNDRPWRSDLWRWVELGPDRTQLIDEARALATQCANANVPVVFCPPVATSRDSSKANEDNLSDGLVISVECDSWPNEAREKLENLLGPASVIVASGGEWIDPTTGEVQPKLHLHWRLAVPARTREEHAALKLARRLATMIARADATGVPPNHPLRWPGSWHRKGKPRLTRIVGGDPERETMLAEALMILRDATIEIDETPHQANPRLETNIEIDETPHQANPRLETNIENVEMWLDIIPNPDRDPDEDRGTQWNRWNNVMMAIWSATGGSEEGFALAERWCARSNIDRRNGARKRWDAITRHPPNRIGAGRLCYLAAEHWVDPDPDDYGDPSTFTVEGDIKQSAPAPKPNGQTPPATPKANGADQRPTDILANIDAASWPVLAPAAYHGLAGSIVKAIEPHSEADPSALLIQFLAAYGNVIGRACYCSIDAMQHHGRLFLALVGDTSVGRKGTAWAQVKRLFNRLQLNTSSGLSTGEGLISAVRDAVIKTKDGVEEIVDEGVADKRLLVIEEEMSRVLRVMARPENILSTILRQAWDGGDLAVMTKSSPARATAPHIAIIAHTTRADIVKYLSSTEAANGFGNRFLFWLTRRSKLLPRGGRIEEAAIQPLVGELDAAVSFADLRYGIDRTEMRINMDKSAWALWDEVYGQLAIERPGMLGAMTARAAPYVRRLALIYALLERSDSVKRVHLEAALECWRYAEASVKYLFATATGDGLADEVLRVLNEAGSQGMTRKQLYDEFGRHKSGADMSRALNLLAADRLVVRERVATSGRPAERYRTLRAH